MECPCFFYLAIHSPSLFSRCTQVAQVTEVNVIIYHIHMRDTCSFSPPVGLELRTACMLGDFALPLSYISVPKRPGGILINVQASESDY